MMGEFKREEFALFSESLNALALANMQRFRAIMSNYTP